jgi:prophage regulatory protein
MKLIRLKSVLSRTGLTRSTLYLMMERNEFPRPLKIAERCVAWPENEIDGWIDSKIADREAA